VIVKVLIKELRLVPFSLLMAQAGNFFGSEGGSWTVPVYILDGRSVAQEAQGNEEAVPPLNVTPHPYELPFLNDLQQHHLNLQVWNQQNADLAWEQEGGEPGLNNQDGWGQWPVAAPPPSPEIYTGVSFRAVTGYEGPSMMDGIVPEHNISDNPAAWSPESDFLSEVEAAADAVVNGAPAGSLFFSRATGAIMDMVVEGRSDPPVEVSAQDGRSLRSMLLVSVAGFLFTPANFAALVEFLSRKIYSLLFALKLPEPVTLGVHEWTDSNDVEGFQFCRQLQFCYFWAKLISWVSGSLPEDRALRFDLNSLLSPKKRNWAAAFGRLMLDEEGKIFWSEDSSSEDLSASFASADSGLVLGGEAEVSSVVGARRRGRPRKTDTPQVESQVKRTLRSNNQGYNYEMLPYQPSRRKVSKVPAASTPAILQIEEMQRIGVEECNIDPAALTIDRLMKQREEKK
jgi:hypothetical protein